jgi:NTE family protein
MSGVDVSLISLARRAAIALGLATCAAAPALACDRTHDPSKPQVALVLSGGGALAASQVGAIKALEEAGVPIHCVLGTSMGAVVGLLYASGYDADELKTRFVGADWGAISTGATAYRNQGFRTKERTRDFFSDYVVGFSNEGVVLPAGLSSLRGMRGFLRDQTASIAHVENFDELPIPYRAMATDLSTGESVALARGDFVDAALASMAVPGLYPSQRIGDRVYIDGGMSKQMPIDTARALGADILIVIDTTVPPADFTSRNPSAVDTVMQLVDLQVWRNRQAQIQQLQPQDVLIHPDMAGYSTFMFDRMAQGYEVGYAAARAVLPRLQAIAASAAPSLRREPTEPKTIAIAGVEVVNASGIRESVILNRFDIQPGADVTRQQIQASVEDVAALGAFNAVDYRLIPTPFGTNIEIDTQPRGQGVQHVQLGARLSTTLGGDSAYALLGRWVISPLNDRAGELAVTGEIGSDVALGLDFTQPFGPALRWFAQPSLNWSRRVIPVDVDNERIAELSQEDVFAGVNVGRELGQWGVATIGAYALDRDVDTRVGDPLVFGAASGQFAGVTGRFAVDTLNSPTFPISGYQADIRLSEIWNLDTDDDAEAGTFILAAANRIGNVGLYARYEGATLSEDALSFPAYTLGGFKRLSGYETSSLPATDYNLFRLEGFTRLGGELESSFGVPVFIGMTLEGAQIRYTILGQDVDYDAFAGSLYGAVDTPIGPAYLAVGIGEGGHESLYLFFGRAF